jgi:hypothetical protein
MLFAGTWLFGQEKPTFISVDTSTYNLYLRGEWEELAKSGRLALKQGIDYYYLEMRIAYALYMKGKYRLAQKYYKRALKFNSTDELANEYLYYSYLNAGQQSDAHVRIKHLTDVQKETMGLIDSINFVSTGIRYIHAFSDAGEITQQIIDGADLTVNGIQKTTLTYRLPKAQFTHRIGRNLLIDHTAGYLMKDEFSYLITGGLPYLSEVQPVTQLDYGINLRITPAEGWLIQPGFHYYYINIPVYGSGSYGPDSGRDRYKVSNLNVRERVFSFLFKKDFRLLETGISYANNNFGSVTTHQGGVHFDLFPLYNLNLYLESDVYFIHHASDIRTRTEYTSSLLLGFKTFRNLWLEFSTTLPAAMQYYDVRNSIGFNLPERTRTLFSSTAIVPLYKSGIKFFAGFYLYQNESLFYPEADVLNTSNAISYSTYLITGGLTWTK